MTNLGNTIRRFGIDALILVLAIVGCILLIRPDFLLSKSLLSATSFISILGVVACMIALMGRVTVDLFRERQRSRARTMEIRKQAFKIAKLRQQAKDKAQLNKPEFSQRLQDFTGKQLDVESSQEPAKSKAEYWEACGLEFGTAAPRPIEFFRMLLHRISKLVRFAK